MEQSQFRSHFKLKKTSKNPISAFSFSNSAVWTLGWINSESIYIWNSQLRFPTAYTHCFRSFNDFLTLVIGRFSWTFCVHRVIFALKSSRSWIYETKRRCSVTVNKVTAPESWRWNRPHGFCCALILCVCVFVCVSAWEIWLQIPKINQRKLHFMTPLLSSSSA